MDTASPNMTYYIDFTTTMLKEAQGTLHPMVKGGARPEDAADWILHQVESTKYGGIVWYGK